MMILEPVSHHNLIVIPARMQATRLPGKPLADIAGIPMIVHVWRRAVAANAGDVIVATDSGEIADSVTAAGGKAIMTRTDHASGSDRVFEAVTKADPGQRAGIIVNLQGDLPTLDPDLVTRCLAPLADPEVDIATLTAVITEPEERTNPNVVKVVGTPIAASTTPAAPSAAPAATPASGPNAGSAGLSAAAIAQAAANNGSGDASGGPVSRQDPSSSAAQDAARARAAYAPVNSLASSSVTSSPAPAPQTTAPAPAQSGSFGSSVTGFFSNMFGGSSAAPAEAQAPSGVTTASTGAVAETSSWTNATVVKEGSAAKSSGKSQKVAAVSPKQGVATKGKYKIHIAAVRSRAEADALAQQLVAQHGADLANHVPTVDEAVIGSMGTFYRVRINGYASQEEPRGLCDKLRSSGLDCLVVTN